MWGEVREVERRWAVASSSSILKAQDKSLPSCHHPCSQLRSKFSRTSDCPKDEEVEARKERDHKETGPATRRNSLPVRQGFPSSGKKAGLPTPPCRARPLTPIPLQSLPVHVSLFGSIWIQWRQFDGHPTSAVRVCVGECGGGVCVRGGGGSKAERWKKHKQIRRN